MMIRVCYFEGYYDVVSPVLLDRLIQTGKIKYFYRRSGKVILGVDKVRTAQRMPYIGSERRTLPKTTSYRRYL